MSNNCKEGGFFLIDLLLSITVFMVIMSSILPMLIHVQKQIVSERQDVSGNHLLYEIANAYLLYGRQERGSIERDGYLFEIVWNDEGRKKKVCVMYENAFQQMVEKCEYIY